RRACRRWCAHHVSRDQGGHPRAVLADARGGAAPGDALGGRRRGVRRFSRGGRGVQGKAGADLQGPLTARLVSLDAFRGLTMAAMVLVNNPGTWRAVYAPLKHADWHGLTPTDVIFPFFLFIVGVAIPRPRRPRARGQSGGLARSRAARPARAAAHPRL